MFRSASRIAQIFRIKGFDNIYLNMRKVFIRAFRFLFTSNGLLFAIGLGLFINIVSDRIDEKLSHQRYEELLQLELRQNLQRSASVFDSYLNDNEVRLDYRISNDVYIAGLNNGYLLEIDEEYLASILSLYSIIPSFNMLIDSEYEYRQSTNQKLNECLGLWGTEINLDIADENDKRCDVEMEATRVAMKSTSEALLDYWDTYYEISKDLTFQYTPTNKRLESPWMKLFMGAESLGIQLNSESL